MTSNIVLDVVIGLVFIYLLYSLLVTILSETISFKLGIRARMLRFAVERMLNDGYYDKVGTTGFLRWAQKFWLYERDEFRTSFAGKFYNSTSIKYLTRVQMNDEQNSKPLFSHTKPSYFSAENFADTIVKLLKEKGMGDTDDEKVGFCLQFNTHGIQDETLAHFISLWETAGHKILPFKELLKKWFEETMDRANGWFKRKVQFISLVIGFIIAVAFNVDTIKITNLLSHDKEARDQLVALSIEMSKDEARYKDFIEGSADSVRTKALDSAFRLIAKDVNKANAVLGLGWDLTHLRKNHRHCITDSAESKSLQRLIIEGKKLVTLQLSYDSLAGKLSRQRAAETKIAFDLRQLRIDSLIFSLDRKGASAIAERTAADANLTSVAKKTIDGKRSLLMARMNIREDSMALVSAAQQVHALRSSINNSIDGDFVSIRSIDVLERPNGKSQIVFKGETPYGTWGKTKYLFHAIYSNFFGFLLTAIALSFGAPFWFDLLKKIVSLRSVGVKPEEKTTPKPTGNENVLPATGPIPTTPTTPAPAPLPIGRDLIGDVLIQNRDAIKSIPGVTSVFVIRDKAPATNHKLQINVIDSDTAKQVKAKFASVASGNYVVNPDVKVTGRPVTQQGPGTIQLKDTNSGEGSFGLVLHWSALKTYHLLSCWHVMKDLSFPKKPASTIIDETSKPIARRWAGGIQGPVDYGLAELNPGQEAKYKGILANALGVTGPVTFRPVEQSDIDSQAPVQFINCMPAAAPVVVHGIIVTDAAEVEMRYPDKIRTVTDVIVLAQSKTNHTTISQDGNSGSVVFDQNKIGIAMIVGGDSNYTYAIKLSTVMQMHPEMTIA